METHSDPVNYELAEEHIAASFTSMFVKEPKHGIAMLRLTSEDYSNLNFQRIAQSMQDAMGEDISWRDMPREEVLVSNGEDIKDDKIVVFKRDKLDEETQ